MGAVVSILMKKAQVVLEIRAENSLLEDHILDIIREEKGYSDQDEIEEEEDDIKEEYISEKKEASPEKVKPEKPIVQPIIEDIEVEEVDDDISEASILEVAEEPETKS